MKGGVLEFDPSPIKIASEESTLYIGTFGGFPFPFEDFAVIAIESNRDAGTAFKSLSKNFYYYINLLTSYREMLDFIFFMSSTILDSMLLEIIVEHLKGMLLTNNLVAFQ